MPRKGRDLEELAARFERLLSPYGAEIKSPDRIPDKLTKELREVDVSIRHKLGSVPILIIVECRDRRTKEDVMWMEQLNSKKESINANQVIAVSRKGFSQPAINYARNHNITLRRISDVTDENIIALTKDIFLALREIIPPRKIDYTLKFYKEHGDPELVNLAQDITAEDPLGINDEGKEITLVSIIDQICKKLVSEPLGGKEKIQSGKLTLEMRVDKGALLATTTVGLRSIHSILINGCFEIRELLLPQLKALNYGDENNTMVGCLLETSHEETGTVTVQVKLRNKKF